MKKKIVTLLLLGTIMCTTGCGVKVSFNAGEDNSANNASNLDDVFVDTEVEPESEPETEPESESQSQSQAVPAAVQSILDEAEDADEVLTQKAEDAMTQTDMNEIASERYLLWDDALSLIVAEYENSLDASELDAFIAEQEKWNSDREAEMEEAAAESEGGSIAPLLRCEAGADYTRSRAYELAQLFSR